MAELRAEQALARLPELVAAIPEQALRERRWFAGKARPIARIDLLDHAQLSDSPPTLLALVEVCYLDGGREVYQLPLAFFEPHRSPVASPLLEFSTHLPSGPASHLVCDASETQQYGLLLLRLIRDGATLPTARGSLRLEALGLEADQPLPQRVRVSGAEQSNTSVVYDQKWILKSYRRVEFGINRDFEVGQFFRQHSPFDRTPLPLGHAEYRPDHGQPTTLAVLHPYVQNEGDGWAYALKQLTAAYRLLSSAGSADESEDDRRRQVEAAAGELLAALAQLGSTTARMHAALAARSDVLAFSPEPVGAEDVQAWADEADAELSSAFRLLRSQRDRYMPALRTRADRLLEREAVCRAHVQRLAQGLGGVRTSKIQVHGDYHLGQVLKTADGFVVIDFEGEVSRPLEQRRARQSPLRDVAGMLRSFDYAASAAARQLQHDGPAPELARYARVCEQEAGRAFLSAYQKTVAAAGLLPASSDEMTRLLDFFQLWKAFYELSYELNNRPDWVEIPLGGIERLVPAETVILSEAKNPRSGRGTDSSLRSE